jgi:dolichol kinase
MSTDAQISFSAELVRKGIHLFALIIPVGYYLVSFPTAIFWVATAAVVSILIDIARFRRWALWSWVAAILTPIIRQHEVSGGFTGASYILTTSTITIMLFPKTIAIAALVFIIVGDAAAALIGRRYGRLRYMGGKSLEGSTACLISSFLASLLVPGLPVMAGLIGALTATVVEACSGSLDDNLTVPLAAGLAMLGVMYYMGFPDARLFGAFF